MKAFFKKLLCQFSRVLTILVICSFFLPASGFGQTEEFQKGYGMQDYLTPETEQTVITADSKFQKGYGMQGKVTLEAEPVVIAQDENLIKGYGLQDEGGPSDEGPIEIPANDLCENAEPITCYTTVSGTTVGATFDDVGDCGFVSNTAPGVWYTFESNGCLATLSTCDQADFDTKISVFTGSCGSLECIAGQDDDATCGGFTTKLTFMTIPGETYYVLVHGFGSATGNFDLTLTCPISFVANDECTCALPIFTNSTVNGTTIGATIDDLVGYCEPGITSPGVWYYYEGEGCMATVTTCDQANFDTKISVYSGSCNNLVCIGGNDDDFACTGLTSTYTFGAAPGSTYYILVHGFGGAVGDFSLTLTCSPPVIANDFCTGAENIGCSQTVSGSTVNATSDGLDFCGTSNTAPGVWYKFIAAGNISTVSTCDQANFDTKLSVFTGSCYNLVCVDGLDDTPGCSGFTTELTVPTIQGETYYVLVHGFGSAAGEFNLSLICGGKIPISNWAVFIGIFLIVVMVIYRFRRLIS